MEPIIEILDPETKPKREPMWRKYGPVIVWGTIIALPAMNMTASIFDYKTAQLNLQIEELKAAAEQLTQ
jgi:hypothetical protein